MKKPMLLLAALLSGCAYNAQLMGRESGRLYSGSVEAHMLGGGSMRVEIDGVTYAGSLATTDVEDGGALLEVTKYKRKSATVVTIGGAMLMKGLLTSAGGRGLRCELVTTGRTGGGECYDDRSRVYDVTFKLTL